MILNAFSALYGAVVSSRRRWYARDPSRRRRLTRPVVSVGNLRAGGSGKTPIVAHVARLLRDAGHRPAVLTRGYGRRQVSDGVTVVSDPDAVLAGVSSAGDEPLMLARALPGVPVLVGADRYLSGLLAERRFGATVHVLDDGFQHLQLARDVDLLLLDEHDLADRPFPGGSLREPLPNAAAADAVLVTAGDPPRQDAIGRTLGVATVFGVSRSLGTARRVADGEPIAGSAGAVVFAVAGIARPERFFTDLAGAGWKVAGTMRFRDHHQYEHTDLERVAAAAAAAGARLVLTTEKDAVRLEEWPFKDLVLGAVPLAARVEPAGEFRPWLLARLDAKRIS